MDKEKELVGEIMAMLDKKHVSYEVALASLFNAFLLVQTNIIKMESDASNTDEFYRKLKMQFINHMDRSYNNIKMQGGFL